MTTQISIQEFGLWISVDDEDALKVLRDAINEYVYAQQASLQRIDDGGMEAYGNEYFGMVEDTMRRVDVGQAILAGFKAAHT
jgi:hypothetical protein